MTKALYDEIADYLKPFLHGAAYFVTQQQRKHVISLYERTGLYPHLDQRRVRIAVQHPLDGRPVIVGNPADYPELSEV